MRLAVWGDEEIGVLGGQEGKGLWGCTALCMMCEKAEPCRSGSGTLASFSAERMGDTQRRGWLQISV